MSTLQRWKEHLLNVVPGLTVSIRGDRDYSAKVAAWNTYTDRKPSVVAQPSNTEQVCAILKALKGTDIHRVVVRGGGHSFEGLGLGGGEDDVLALDMIKMQRITPDSQRNTITAEGGALLGQISLHAWEHGKKMLPMGTCPGVGAGRQSQCGGYGFYSRSFGTLTDRVLSFEVVTADGEARNVSDTENSDLFFALRGSGMGTFGVVTSVTLRTNDTPQAMGGFSLRWKLAHHDIGAVLKALQRACLSAPLTVHTMIVAWLGVLEVAGYILENTEDEREETFKRFEAELPKPDVSSFQPMGIIDSIIHVEQTQTSAPWYNSIEDIKREGDEYPRYMKIKAGFVPNQFSDDFLEKLGKFLKTQPPTGVRVQLLALNPNSTAKPDTTSIKVRGCPWLMGMSVYLQASEYGRENLEVEARKRLPWLQEAYELFYPLTAGGYLGDDDYDEALKDRDIFQSYYGQHLPQLSAIKRRYDPGNLFHHPLSVGLAP